MRELKVPSISNEFKTKKLIIQHKKYLQNHISNLEVFQVDFDDGTPMLGTLQLRHSQGCHEIKNRFYTWQVTWFLVCKNNVKLFRIKLRAKYG